MSLSVLLAFCIHFYVDETAISVHIQSNSFLGFDPTWIGDFTKLHRLLNMHCKRILIKSDSCVFYYSFLLFSSSYIYFCITLNYLCFFFENMFMNITYAVLRKDNECVCMLCIMVFVFMCIYIQSRTYLLTFCISFHNFGLFS